MNTIMKVAVASMVAQNTARYARQEMDHHAANKKAMVSGIDRAMQIAEKYDLISADKETQTAKLVEPDLPDLNQEVALNELTEAVDAIDVAQGRATEAAVTTVLGHTVAGAVLGTIGMAASMIATEIALGIGSAAITPVGVTVLGITAGAAIYTGISKAKDLFDQKKAMKSIKEHISEFKDKLSAKFNSLAHKDESPSTTPALDTGMGAQTDQGISPEKPKTPPPGTKMTL